MKRRKLINIASLIYWGALFACSMWLLGSSFQSFQEVNPNSGFVDYLFNPRSGVGFGALLAVGVGVVGILVSRYMRDRLSRWAPAAKREDPDEESKRLFSEARGQ